MYNGQKSKIRPLTKTLFKNSSGFRNTVTDRFVRQNMFCAYTSISDLTESLSNFISFLTFPKQLPAFNSSSVFFLSQDWNLVSLKFIWKIETKTVHKCFGLSIVFILVCHTYETIRSVLTNLLKFCTKLTTNNFYFNFKKACSLVF